MRVLPFPLGPLKEPDACGSVGLVVDVLLHELYVSPRNLEACVLITLNLENCGFIPSDFTARCKKARNRLPRIRIRIDKIDARRHGRHLSLSSALRGILFV